LSNFASRWPGSSQDEPGSSMKMGIWEFLWNPCVDLRTGKPRVLPKDEQKCLLDLDLGGLPEQREVLHCWDVLRGVEYLVKYLE
jgi:hypothetical protein